MSTDRGIRVLAAGALVFGVLLVAGCDESEQGRILRYEKGTYLGKPDTALTEQQLDELRHRARLQQGS